MLTSTLIKKFIVDCRARRLSKKTIQRYTDDCNRLQTFLLSHRITHAHRITHDTLRQFFAELHETIPKRKSRITESNHGRLSPFTTAGIYRSINTFFHWCEREGHLDRQPMSRLKPPRTPKRIIKRLSEAQLRLLLEEIQKTKEPTRNLAIALLLVDSGLRRGEAFSLHTRDIHTESRYICVTGKGEKEREVPIGEVTCDAIQRWMLVRPKTKSKFLFVKHSGEPLTAECIRSVLRRIRDRMNLERLYPHLLRHTFSKLYLKKGNVEKLSKILGHSKIETTIEEYVQDFDIDDLIEDHSKGSPVDRLNQRSKIRTPAET